MDSWEDELEAEEQQATNPQPPAPAVEAPKPAEMKKEEPKKATVVVSAKSKVLLGSKGKEAPVAAAPARKLTAQEQFEEKQRIQREMEDADRELADDLFGVSISKSSSSAAATSASSKSAAQYEDEDEYYDDEEEEEEFFEDEEEEVPKKKSSGGGKGGKKATPSSDSLENIQFKSPEDAVQFAAQFATTIRQKCSKRDPVLMAFLREFLCVSVDGLKIDDLNEVKNHITTLYNTKKTAKQQSKPAGPVAAKASAGVTKKGSLSMYDAFGSEEASGRGALGGKLSNDPDDYDFM